VALGITWRLAAQHVGIGTSAPDARLHVQTPSTVDFIRTGWFQNQRNAADNNGVLIDIARAAADAYALNVRSGAGLTSRLYVRGDGNVGIGTTSPGFGLDVEKGTRQTFAKFGDHHPLYVAANRPSIGFNLYYDNDPIDGPFWRFGKGSTGHYGGVISVNPATGTMSIYTSNSGNAGNLATTTERVTILQNGNVGIGSTNPGFGLDVEKGTGATFAKFGNQYPLYVTANWPNIGFNLYFDGSWRFGKGSTAHYGGVIGVDPGTGRMYIHTTNSGNAGNPATTTERVTILQNGNVGIGTTTPAERLHVVGRAIVNDGTTGTPTNSTSGSDGSRIILWPGGATATPYQIGIASSEMWTGVPSGASWSVFRGTDRQLIVRPTMPVGNVGGSTNFPSITLGNLRNAYSSGPYPKRGTFLYFGGPTNDFEDNTDRVLMYVVHLASDVTRLRLHVEDNGETAEGFSILGAACAGNGGCFDDAGSSLLFDFAANGQAYKPNGGQWAALSDARLKEDIRPYTRGLAELRALRPVRYKYKKEYWAASDRHFTGLIAQEVQDVVPEMVHPYKFQAIGDKLMDVLAVDPSDLTYMLINAVKELDAENQRLKARLAAVEAEKQALEARLSLIESRLSALEGLRGSKE